MKITKNQLKELIIEGLGDKIFSMIDPTFHDEQESIRAIGRGDPIVSVEKAINALIPLSLDYRDASDALTSLRRLRKQLRSKPLQEMSGYRNPADVRRGERMARNAQFSGTGILKPGAFAAGTHSPPPLVDSQVKAAADYLESGIRSSIDFAEHPAEANPIYQIERTIEAMQYETNFTDVMFPGVDLDEVRVELMQRFEVGA